jgi:hypothetical protein
MFSRRILVIRLSGRINLSFTDIISTKENFSSFSFYYYNCFRKLLNKIIFCFLRFSKNEKRQTKKIYKFCKFYYFFAYRNESGTFFRRKIVLKVELFYTKIVVKVVLFCIILFHLLGDDCQSIPIFFCNFS